MKPLKSFVPLRSTTPAAIKRCSAANSTSLRLTKEKTITPKKEALMRRALAIDEASFGPDHPNVARHLNNLALLLQDTNRLSDAEPLSRRCLEIFLQFTATTSHEHPHLRTAIANYSALLEKMGRSPAEIRPNSKDSFSRCCGSDNPRFNPCQTSDNA